VKNIFLCLFSAFLLRLAFPPWDFWALAGIGLVPFLHLLDGKRARSGFGYGYLLGVLFFGSTLWWFIHVTLPGMILLVLYLSLYFAVFGWCSSLFSHRLSPLARLFFLPSLWVALEYLRGWLFTGFGWVTLGHSQYKNLMMIQIADITGSHGVSFVVVMTNVLLKEFCGIFSHRKKTSEARLGFALAVGLIMLFVYAIYGFVRLHTLKVNPGPSVAVIQANIAQSEKWEGSRWPGIMKKYRYLTREAAADHPDLIIWPETAFPGFIWEAPELFLDLQTQMRLLETPLLLGIVTQRRDLAPRGNNSRDSAPRDSSRRARPEDLAPRDEYHNSALLISSTGRVDQEHDKLHLVPFGEYVPLRGIFPFLSHIVPIGDFTPGKEYALFSLEPLRRLDLF